MWKKLPSSQAGKSVRKSDLEGFFPVRGLIKTVTIHTESNPEINIKQLAQVTDPRSDKYDIAKRAAKLAIEAFHNQQDSPVKKICMDMEVLKDDKCIKKDQSNNKDSKDNKDEEKEEKDFADVDFENDDE